MHWCCIFECLGLLQQKSVHFKCSLVSLSINFRMCFVWLNFRKICTVYVINRKRQIMLKFHNLKKCRYCFSLGWSWSLVQPSSKNTWYCLRNILIFFHCHTCFCRFEGHKVIVECYLSMGNHVSEALRYALIACKQLNNSPQALTVST